MPGTGTGGTRRGLVPGEAPLGLRVAGATLAAILAALAIAIAVWADRALVPSARDSPIGVVFGPDGIARGDPVAATLVWAVGPVAAAIAGFIFSASAVRLVDGSGLWMGALSYVVAIVIAPVVLVPDAVRDGVGPFVRNLGVVPFVWMLAGVALGPLLLVCLVAGPIWATILRLTTGGSGRGDASSGSLPVWPVIALTVLVLLGFAVVMAVFGAMGDVGGGIID
jgi:hypothetical protein